MPRTVAVTGAAGFLGRHLVAALAREGAVIRILARRDPGADFCHGIDFETIYGDMESPEALARLMAGADAVVHVAGLIQARNRAAFLRGNRDGAAAVAQAARRLAPEARFVSVSSLAAREPQLSDYAFSKHAGEEAVRAAYAAAEGLLVIIRPPALYGPWDNATLPIFRAAALPLVPVLGAGRVSILHVTDAARALARVAMGAGGAGLFALPGGDYSLEDVAVAAARAQGCEARLVHVPGVLLRAAGVVAGIVAGALGRATVFNAGKARELLHPDWVVHADEALPAEVYVPEIGMAEGFEETVEWYRSKKLL